MSARVDDALELLEGFAAPDDESARTSLAETRGLLATGEAAFDRDSYDPGHITASALLLSPDGGRVLLVYHRRLGLWLQPGGHIEPSDVSVIAAARREALEETGVVLAASATKLVAVDVHQIPAAGAEPAHRHHDLMFAFSLTGRAEPAGGEAARWWPVGAVAAWRGDAPVRRGLARALGTDAPPAREGTRR